MIKLLMKTLKLIRTKEENSDMKYAALCTGCGAIVPFDIEFSTNVTINYQNTAADRFVKHHRVLHPYNAVLLP